MGKFSFYQMVKDYGQFEKGDIVVGYQSLYKPGYVVVVKYENPPVDVKDIEEIGIISEAYLIKLL